MTWLKTLAETYDAYSDSAGIFTNDQPILLPIFHSTFKAQIEVTIDGDGNFIDARKLEDGNDCITVIPVTEDSESRSSGIAPHSLCDNLCYIAGDYARYTESKEEKYHEKYMEQLTDWVNSDDTHLMVQAIYTYLLKKSLVHDLVDKGVLELDENGKLTDKTKINSQTQIKANVRFIVYEKNDMFKESAVWKNQELYQKYIQYCLHKAKTISLCYAFGDIVPCSYKHPSKIRDNGDMTKIISGNDEQGFTYRGRFATKEQAVAVGYVASQKAHNALRWLIQKQGYTKDDSAFVCWMVNRNMQLPNLMKDSVNAYNDIDDFDSMDLLNLVSSANLNKQDTGKHFADQFKLAVNGYAQKINLDDRVAVMSLDSATQKKGRLSIVYYDEMGGKQYIDAILNWQEHCKWKRWIRLEKSNGGNQTMLLECTPTPRDMALAAFGVLRSGRLDADSKVIRAAVKRLLPCITKIGVKIPRDIIKSAARRASMPESMKTSVSGSTDEFFVWKNNVLSVVCAMIRFNYEENDKTMENFLSDNENDRSVLFGRLLAVYDYMERRAMFERDENGYYKEQRPTNAKRYWNAFSNRPAKTSQTIRQNLIPYERKLSDFERNMFEKWTEEIMVCLAKCGFNNALLSEMYLPGYYLQMEDMQNYFKNYFNKKEQ